MRCGRQAAGAPVTGWFERAAGGTVSGKKKMPRCSERADRVAAMAIAAGHQQRITRIEHDIDNVIPETIERTGLAQRAAIGIMVPRRDRRLPVRFMRFARY